MNMCTTPEENPAVQRFCEVAKELSVVLPIQFLCRRLEIPVLNTAGHHRRGRGDPGVLPQDPHPGWIALRGEILLYARGHGI